MGWIVEDRASIILYNILKELQLKNYKKVYLPSNVCPIVPAILLKVKMPFEFIDINLDDYCMDLAALLKKITPHQKLCVLYVRNYGYLKEIDESLEWLRKKNSHLYIIDDRCPARPAFNKNDYSEAADFTVFSTGYAKYVELGYGGFGYNHNEDIIYKKRPIPYCADEYDSLVKEFRLCLESQKKFSYKDTDWLGDSNKNLSFDEYKKKVLEKREEIDKHKKKINEIYFSQIERAELLPEGFHDWRFNILVKNKKIILKKIFESSLFASSHYASISHIFNDDYSKNAEKLHKNVINLFNDHRIEKDAAEKIVEIINKYA